MNINISSPITGHTSYGLVAINLIDQLIKAGHSVSAFPIGGRERVDCPPKYIPSIKQALDNSDEFDYNAPSVRLFHQFSLAESIGRGPKIGYPIFELDTFTNLEKRHIESCDFIFVCSKWAQEIIIKNVPNLATRTKVVPLGVNRDIFHEKIEPLEFLALDSTGKEYFIKGDSYTFLNCGKWEQRKGHDVLLKAFELAFKKEDDVKLILSCHNQFLSTEQTKKWHDYYKNSELGDKIYILKTRLDTQEELATLMSTVDCGVFPSRAEGWNLELLEMMSCNKPVITTNYSGHTEYANVNNSLLVQPELLEPAYDGIIENKCNPIWFYGQGNWMKYGEYEIKTLAGHMRDMFDNKTNFNWSGLSKSHSLTWKNSADTLINMLQRNL